MDSNNKLKKILKKQKRHQHILVKETNVKCCSNPTKNIAICNAGLVNGLSEEIIFQHFHKFGTINRIVLIPEKSCCFLTYNELKSAQTAYENLNGVLAIAQDNKPVYLSYVEELPDIYFSKDYNNVPPGALLLPDFVTKEEEIKLIELCVFNNTPSQNIMKNRNVKHFGYEFRYDINNVDKEKPLPDKIPSECNFIFNRLRNECKDFPNFLPDQLTVNQYLPGQGIPPHIDTHSAFEDPIMSLSLGSTVVMEFRHDDGRHICLNLLRRSLLVMSGESRYNWTHGITPRKLDVVLDNDSYNVVERQTRISFTFRKILKGECKCNFKSKCDLVSNCETAMEDQVAAKLEESHVHEVYDKIANHFSDTRHKPWPNVLDFVLSFKAGDILIDVGCGNGKYLGHNKNVYDVGCDRSIKLLELCDEKGYEVFNCNSLLIPLRDEIADGVLSIAVIHHFANKNRRIQAVREIIRVLRKGGVALIYVWSKDQHKDEKKSSYLKQDRKNRKSNQTEVTDQKSEEVAVLQGLNLPVHSNRTQFKHKDLLVPWKLKQQNNEDTYLRFYHVFEEGELEELCKIANSQIIIEKSYYDQGNWCVVLKKV